MSSIIYEVISDLEAFKFRLANEKHSKNCPFEAKRQDAYLDNLKRQFMQFLRTPSLAMLELIIDEIQETLKHDFYPNQEYPSQDIFCQNLREESKKLQNLSTPPLSPKEIECLCLNLNGFSAKQIGLLMSISYRTVQTHIQHSLDKLQCFNKYQCFEMMYEKGFLPIWQDFFNLLLKRYPNFR